MENAVFLEGRKQAIQKLKKAKENITKYERLHPYESAPNFEYCAALDELRRYFTKIEIALILKKLN